MTPRDWRLEGGRSQDFVARMVGLSGKNPARTWQQWEAGQRQPPIEVVAKIEALSEGRVTAADWAKLRRDFRASQPPREPARSAAQ